MNPLVWIGKALRWIGGLFAPMFVRPNLSPGLLWTLHVILIAAVCVGLYFVQQRFNLSQHIRGPAWFVDYWMSIVFLIVYFLAWQAWWLWKLFQPGEALSPFPDIDEAWSGVMDALDKAGIGIADTAVYVVMGQPRSGDAGLFQTLPRGLTINGGTSGAAPVRVFASRDAIYLTCPGVTLLNRAGGYEGGGKGPESVTPASMALDASIGMDKSIGMMSEAGGAGSIQQVQRIIRTAQEQRRPLSDEEKILIRQLSGEGGYAPERQQGGGGGGRGSILQDAIAVERQTARMNYFCSLVSQARWPLCPINGAVILASMADAERDESAQQMGLVAQKDLANMVDALKLKFPVYALVCDLDTLPGADVFLQRFAADKRQQRLGKSFPLNPDLKPAAVPDAVETNVNWIFSSLLPYWVYKLFRLEMANVESPNEASQANGALTQFLVAVRDRSSKIARLVSRAVVARVDDVPAVGGCYLTAPDPGGSEPLFTQEFFKKVESTQGFVTWTDEAYSIDAGYRGTTKTGYMALVAIAAAVIGLAVYVLFFRGS
jgi:IcmF-related N-terminal domain